MILGRQCGNATAATPEMPLPESGYVRSGPESMVSVALRKPAFLLGSLAAAAGLYLGAATLVGLEDLLRALFTVAWPVIVLGCGLTFAGFVFRYARWTAFLRLFGYRLPHRMNFPVYLAGLALTTTPGKAGETVRSLFLRQLGVPYSASLAAFVCDRLADLIAILAITAVAGGMVLGATTFAWTALATVLAGLLAFVIVVRRIHPPTFGRWGAAGLLQRVQPFADSIRRCISHPLYFPMGILVAALAYGLQAVAFGFILGHLGYELPWATLVFVFFSSTLAGAASMIPGGLGAMELAMSGMLVHFGVPAPTALAATLVTRLVTLWFAVALGGACALAVRARLRGSAPDCGTPDDARSSRQC